MSRIRVTIVTDYPVDLSTEADIYPGCHTIQEAATLVQRGLDEKNMWLVDFLNDTSSVKVEGVE